MPEKPSLTIALYARVSKDEVSDDGSYQNPENQLVPLRELCARNGWTCEEFVERASGGSDRPVFQKMLSRACRREFDGILFWSIDRFSREGILNTLYYFERLRNAGVWAKSLQESWLDTNTPFAEPMLAMFSWFAQYEKKRISDRTKAALARKKRDGMQLGRPRVCLKCGYSHKATKKCREPVRPGYPKNAPPIPAEEETPIQQTGVCLEVFP